MKNWMLITVAEREVEQPEFFNTHEEAFDIMCERISEIAGITKEEAVESYLSGKQIDSWTCIGENYAWSDSVGCYDWKIINIEGRC